MGVDRKLLVSISNALRLREGGGQPSLRETQYPCTSERSDWACPVSLRASGSLVRDCTSTAKGISLILQLQWWYMIITSSGGGKTFCTLVKGQVVNVIRSNNTLPSSRYDVCPGTVEFYTCALTLCGFIFPYANQLTDDLAGFYRPYVAFLRETEFQAAVRRAASVKRGWR